MKNETVTLDRELVEKIPEYMLRGVKGAEDVIEALRAALAEPVPPAGGEVEVVTAAWLDLSKLDKGSMAYATAMKVNRRQTELVDRAHVTRLQAEVAHQEAQHEAATRYAQTCLMAEADALAERDALRSELTKAREELEEWKRGSRAEAQAGDEARAEVGRLRAELSTANDKLRRQDIASQYKDGQIAKHDGELAMLQSELTKARELLKEALCDLPYSFARHNIEAYFARQSAPAAKDDTK